MTDSQDSRLTNISVGPIVACQVPIAPTSVLRRKFVLDELVGDRKADRMHPGLERCRAAWPSGLGHASLSSFSVCQRARVNARVGLAQPNRPSYEVGS